MTKISPPETQLRHTCGAGNPGIICHFPKKPQGQASSHLLFAVCPTQGKDPSDIQPSGIAQLTGRQERMTRSCAGALYLQSLPRVPSRGRTTSIRGWSVCTEPSVWEAHQTAEEHLLGGRVPCIGYCKSSDSHYSILPSLSYSLAAHC